MSVTPGISSCVRAVVPRQAAQRTRGHHQRDGAERQIDPENERPVQMIGEQAAEHRTKNAGAHEHHRRVALRHRALARRKQVGDDGLRDRDKPAAADPLQGAADDQDPDRRRQRAGERADNENPDRQQHDGAAAVDVGELAEQRRRRRRGDEGRRSPPRKDRRGRQGFCRSPATRARRWSARARKETSPA